MRFRSTLVLAVVFLVLGVYLYFVEFRRAAEEGAKETLFDFEVDEVQSVTLAYPDRTITVRRQDGKWKLTAPIEAAADDTVVDNLLNAVANCEVKKSLDDPPEDLSPFGLDTPKVTVNVVLESRQLPGIRVGKTSPVGFSTYIQREDEEKIYLTTSAFQSGMDKQVKDLRNKQILDFPDADVRRIVLRRGGDSIELARADDVWRIERPGAFPADADAVRGFLSSLRSLRAKDFPSEGADDLEPFGLAPARLEIELGVGADGALTRVLFGKEAEDKSVYVKVGDRATIFTVGDWSYRDADKTTADFRDKTILPAAKGDVHEIRFEREGGEKFLLKREGDSGWKIDGGAAIDSTVDAFLDDLLGLEGYEIVSDEPGDLAAYGLDPAARKVTLLGKDGAVIGAARFGSHSPEPPATEHTAMREGSPTVYHVRDFQITRIDKSAGDFLPKPTPTVTPGS
jgi:hypothetical protein